MAKKISKNLQRVQNMLDGTHKNKIQVSMNDNVDVHANKKVGDKWKDSDGVEWEQMNGYRSKVSTLGRHHSWDEKCSGCEKLIMKKWFAYRRLKDFKNMKSIQKEMEQWIDEVQEQRKENPFDMRVANALANANVEMQINKNT